MISGIWFYDVSFMPFLPRRTGVGALVGLRLWGSRRIMGCQDGSRLAVIARIWAFF